jgi:micrococcal nuclease
MPADPLSLALRSLPKKYRYVAALAIAVLLTWGGASLATTDAPTDVPAGFVAVAKVIDGDTLDVVVDGKTERLRLIGINTPETVDPRRPVQCYGKEASNRLKELLQGQVVRIEADPTQDDVDKYGRLLRYVTMADGTLVNLALVADGYAYEYTYGTPYLRQAEFRLAQDQAKEEGRGLWNPAACDGKK